MKNGILTLTVLLPLLATAPNLTAAERPTPPPANATNRFTITGMHCDGCAKGLQAELAQAPGVASATVTFTNRLAVVAYDTNRTTTAHLVKVEDEAGFKARPVTR